jgi:hypothetical protein
MLACSKPIGRRFSRGSIGLERKSTCQPSTFNILHYNNNDPNEAILATLIEHQQPVGMECGDG